MKRSMSARILFAAASVALALGGSSPAHAVDIGGVSDVIAITGCVDIDPPGVLLVGGSGTYHDAACQGLNALLPTTCTVVSVPDVPGGPIPEPIGCWHSIGPGTFTSVVPGTGTASGRLKVIESDGGTISGDYLIAFVAGEGVVLIQNASESDSTNAILQYAVGTASHVPGNLPAPINSLGYVATITTTEDVPSD